MQPYCLGNKLTRHDKNLITFFSSAVVIPSQTKANELLNDYHERFNADPTLLP